MRSSILVLAVSLCCSCATLKTATPVVKTIEQIAQDVCLNAELQDRSPFDVDPQTFCRDQQVISAIVDSLLLAQRQSRARLAAMHTLRSPDAGSGQ